MSNAGRPLGQTAVDAIELGGIVTIRDRLLAMQAKGKPILRLESGDPSFSVPPHVKEAMDKALRDGQTHYTAGAGIPPLRQAAYDKIVGSSNASGRGNAVNGRRGR